MSERNLRFIGFGIVVAIVFAVYRYSMAPTAAFWDCAELIAASYIAGIPHPPGTPLFVMLGRLFSLLPVNPEIAFRITLIPVLFGSLSCGLIYLLVVKLISQYSSDSRFRWMPHLAGVFAGLMCAFAYSYWDNCVEAEVYGPCVVVALSVLYMALVWRDRVRSGSDNRLVLLAVFLLFLSTGIHFTPMMVVFAVLIYVLVVDRQTILQLRLFEFLTGYLVVLTVTDVPGPVMKVLAAALMLATTWLAVRVMEKSERTTSVLWGLGLLVLMYLIGYVASSGRIMDNSVLFLASPTVALIEMWVQSRLLVVLFLLGFGAYLYWLRRQGRLSLTYVGLMLGLVFLAGTVQFFMLIRARMQPSINEVNPSNWRDFVSVLRREQYDPMRLLPRKTQFLTEEDWRMNQNPRFSVLVAYFEQIKFYLRYFFWQWGNERFFDIFLGIKWQALLGLVPPLLGLWGIWHQFKNDKRSFVLIFIAFLVASLGLVTYLNLKYSPSDPRRGDPARGGLGYLEVRERDYFYAFSFVFFTVFVGIGAHAFLRLVAESFRSRRLVVHAAGTVLALFSFVPMLLNYATVTRRYNWIPAEYGYNMLVSCPGDKAVVFTNGDNDTFPLWFMQTVPSRVAGYDTMFGKNVAVGILSLLNTSWYCKQLKRWGAPISFSESEIDRLPRAFAGKNGRTFLLEDVMIRDMVATSAGIKLKWPDDYGSTSEEFKAKVFGSGYHPRTPVYFATTVAREKLADVQPYVRLEGLVYRVVPEPADNQVDIERSYDLLMNQYQMSSMLDPRVSKDDNTRGLFITYAASYLGLATELRRVGRSKDAEEVTWRATRFDLDPDKRATLFYHLSVFALENGNLDRALAALDTVKLLGLTNPEFDIQRGAIFEAKGDWQKAEQAYLAALAAGSQRPVPVQALTRIYLDKLHDTVRARSLLKQWLERAPQDSTSAQLLRQLS